MLKKNRMLIFEEWLLDKAQGNIPFDYKIHVLKGGVFSMFAFDRNGKEKFLTILDKDWNIVPVEKLFIKPINGYNFNDPRANRMVPDNPEHRQKLIETALKLWQVFNKPHFTRFDLYLIDGNVYFGEVTVICGGLKIGTVRPKVIDKLMKESPWK